MLNLNDKLALDFLLTLQDLVGFPVVPDSGGSSQAAVCLENMDHRKEKLCDTTEEIWITVERFLRLGLTADLAHLGLTGADSGSLIDEFADRIAHLHVSGVVHGQPHGRISPAASSIDLRLFLKVFRGKEIAAVIENRPWEIMIESTNILDAFR